MKTLEEIIAQVPAGHQWLIRSDKEKGYLANITTPGFVNDLSVACDGEDHFYTFAPTPQAALECSVERAKRAIKYMN